MSEEIIYKAKLAEQAQRYDDMLEEMKKVASMKAELMTAKERQLLIIAYKNVIEPRRKSLRIISLIEQKQKEKCAEETIEMIANYRSQVEQELRHYCADILNVIDEHWIPCASTSEVVVNNYKLKGDFQRYLAEFATGTDRKNAADIALKAYEAASDIALTDLPPTHTVRLCLALNFSVFYEEILNSPDIIYRVAKLARDNAMT